MNIVYTDFVEGPYQLILAFHQGKLIFLERKKDHDVLKETFPKATLTYERDAGKLVKKQLKEYFSGKRKVFDFPYAFEVGTPFQQEVWKKLGEVPYGTTMSYSDLAGKTSREKAVRAAATAVGKNPLMIIIPCHRILPKDPKKGIGNFGGGVDLKAFLLKLEGSC